MRKIILNLAVSLDGFIEDQNGSFDWCLTDQDYSEGQFDRFDAVLMGRKSYDLMQEMQELPIPGKEVFVFSNSLKKAKNASIVNSKDMVREVMRLKSGKGNDIWFFGGANLLTSFLERELIDELQLGVHPILLGSGKRLFEGNLFKRMNCKLIDSKHYDTGLVILKYRIKA